MTAHSAAAHALVIQPLPGIGDAVWHLPALTAIASLQAQGRVDLLTKQRSHADELFRDQTWLGEVLWLERDAEGMHAGPRGMLRLAAALRARNYRQVWILHPSIRYGLLARLARIPERYGYGVGAQSWFLNRGPYLRAAKTLHPLRRQAQYLAALARGGIIAAQAVDQPRLAAPANPAAPFPGDPLPVIAYGIGCSEAGRRWPVERFAALIQSLYDRYGGTHVLLAGGADRAQVDAVLARVSMHEPESLIVYLDKPLDAVVSLLARVDLFAGNDTGVLNIAAALGRPTIGLFGQAISHVLAEYFPAIIPVHASGNGMQGIDVGQVLSAACAVLNLERAGAG